jgi:hypothetical protein
MLQLMIEGGCIEMKKSKTKHYNCGALGLSHWKMTSSMQENNQTLSNEDK